MLIHQMGHQTSYLTLKVFNGERSKNHILICLLTVYILKQLLLLLFIVKENLSLVELLAACFWSQLPGGDGVGQI